MTFPARIDAVAKRHGMAIVALCAVLVMLRVLASAWVAEDAFITFRTIDNFVNGHGLRWNVDQRVQTYTHPLWMLVNTIPYVFARDVPSTVTAMGILCTTSTWVLFARRLVSRSATLLVVLLFAFLLSPSLSRYGTSGFESSLAYLLLACFALLVVPDKGGPRLRSAFTVAALAMVNRLDHSLIYLPSLVVLLAMHRGWRLWIRAVSGLIPLIAWLTFATIYYGFPLPNTAAAKLPDQISRTILLREGLHYAWDLPVRDPVAAAIAVVGLAVTIICARAGSRGGRPTTTLVAALGVGAALYGGYVIWIGGDFISARFWVAPVFAWMLVIGLGMRDVLGPAERSSRRLAFALVVVLTCLSVGSMALKILAPGPARSSVHRVSLGHMYLAHDARWQLTPLAAQWVQNGDELRERAATAGRRIVALRSEIGFLGYHAGPDVVLIDRYALTDPFLARLPLDPDRQWRIGHIPRIVPDGYPEARLTGRVNRLKPPIRGYYLGLRLLASGPVFDGGRFRSLLRYNLTQRRYAGSF
jgi:arabinofuranosyltransferase